MDSRCFPCLCLGGRKKETPPAPAMDHDVAAFAFKELAAATRKFRKDRLIGREPGLYKAYLKSVKQILVEIKRLDWNTRMKIAAGVANGLAYLHEHGLSLKLDVYNFGVVLLVLITGRRAFDSSPAATGERPLAAWARPLLEDREEFPGMVDPALEGRYALTGLDMAMALVSTCLRENPAMRPSMGTVIAALAQIADSPAEPLGTSTS